MFAFRPARWLTALLVLALGGLWNRSSQAANKQLAVLEFQSGKLDGAALNAFSDAVRGGALDELAGRGVNVMTRESMMVLLKDMGKKECSEGDCEVETGRNIGADYVVSATLARIEGTYVVTLKLHETKGGSLLATDMVEAKSQLEMLRTLREHGRRLVARRVVPPAAPSAPLARERAPEAPASPMSPERAPIHRTDGQTPTRADPFPTGNHSIRSTCANTVRSDASGYALGNGWCFYLVEPDPPGTEYAVTFRARLRNGSGYGFWFDGQWDGGRVSAMGIQYDPDAGGIKFLRYPETESDYRPRASFAADNNWHAWRLQRGTNRERVWIDGQLLVDWTPSSPNHSIGFRTWRGIVEIAGLTVSR